MAASSNINGNGNKEPVKEGVQEDVQKKASFATCVDKMCTTVLNGHFSSEKNLFFTFIANAQVATIWKNLKGKCHTDAGKITAYGVFYELVAALVVSLSASALLHSLWVSWPLTRVIPLLYSLALWVVYEVHLTCSVSGVLSRHVETRAKDIKHSVIRFFCEVEENEEGEVSTEKTDKTDKNVKPRKEHVATNLKLTVVVTALFFCQMPLRWLFISISALPLLGAVEVMFVAIVVINCAQQLTGRKLLGGKS